MTHYLGVETFWFKNSYVISNISTNFQNLMNLSDINYFIRLKLSFSYTTVIGHVHRTPAANIGDISSWVAAMMSDLLKMRFLESSF